MSGVVAGTPLALPVDKAHTDTSAWSGTPRLGVKALVTKATLVELGAGNLSVGQNGLHSWEGRLYVSHAF